MTTITAKPTSTATLLLILATLSFSSISQADNTPRRVNPVQTHQQGFAPVFQIPFSANCAAGFNKVAEKQANSVEGKWVDEFVCSTQTITCPKQTLPGGKVATVQPKVAIQTSFVDPDGGTVKFKVQYKCDYSYSYTPEG